jgi:hypothetical protein
MLLRENGRSMTRKVTLQNRIVSGFSKSQRRAAYSSRTSCSVTAAPFAAASETYRSAWNLRLINRSYAFPSTPFFRRNERNRSFPPNRSISPSRNIRNSDSGSTIFPESESWIINSLAISRSSASRTSFTTALSPGVPWNAESEDARRMAEAWTISTGMGFPFTVIRRKRSLPKIPLSPFSDPTPQAGTAYANRHAIRMAHAAPLPTWRARTAMERP